MTINKTFFSGFEEQLYWTLYLEDLDKEVVICFYKNDYGVLLEDNKEIDFSWELIKNVIKIGYDKKIKYIKLLKKDENGFIVNFYGEDGDKKVLLSSGKMRLVEDDVLEEKAKFSYIEKMSSLERYEKLKLFGSSFALFLLYFLVALFLPFISKSVVLSFILAVSATCLSGKISYYIYEKFSSILSNN